MFKCKESPMLTTVMRQKMNMMLDAKRRRRALFYTTIKRVGKPRHAIPEKRRERDKDVGSNVKRVYLKC